MSLNSAKKARKFPRIAVILVVLLTGAGTATKSLANPAFHEGELLVAARKIPDVRFAETVIFLCRHNAEGALGLILNRPAGTLPLTNLLRSLGVETKITGDDIQIRIGGPVQLEAGFVMHESATSNPNRICAHHGVTVSSNEEIIKKLGTSDGPTSPVLFFGYTGWGPGQLEGEMRRKDWVTVPASRRLLFDPDLKNLWRKAISRRGVEL